MSLPAADKLMTFRRATAVSEFGELVLLLVYYGIGAAFAACILYIGCMELPEERTPCLALAAIVGGAYGLALGAFRGVLPYLRRSVRLEENHVVIGAGVFAARVRYAKIREVWTAPNEILHKWEHNRWPPGVFFRIRTDARTYEIPLRYDHVDACAVIIWQRSGLATYWDMHGRMNPPAAASRRVRAVRRYLVLHSALPHMLTVAILIVLAVASTVIDVHDSNANPPSPPVWFTFFMIGLFSAAPVWQCIQAFRKLNPDITRYSS